MPLLLPGKTRQARYYLTCIAELHKIRVLGRVPGAQDPPAWIWAARKQLQAALLLDQLHVPLWALASQGVRTWRLRLDEKQKVDVADVEGKGQSTKVGMGEAGWRCVVWQCCDSFGLSKQPFVTTYLEKVKQNFGSVKHFQKTLSAVSTLKMKHNLTKQNGHHRYYSVVVLHS